MEKLGMLAADVGCWVANMSTLCNGKKPGKVWLGIHMITYTYSNPCDRWTLNMSLVSWNLELRSLSSAKQTSRGMYRHFLRNSFTIIPKPERLFRFARRILRYQHHLKDFMIKDSFWVVWSLYCFLPSMDPWLPLRNPCRIRAAKNHSIRPAQPQQKLATWDCWSRYQFFQWLQSFLSTKVCFSWTRCRYKCVYVQLCSIHP